MSPHRSPEPAPDTIAAISTPPGRGGIGIVRLSGPDALSIAAHLLQLTNPEAQLADPAHHAHARRARILDPTSLPAAPHRGPQQAQLLDAVAHLASEMGDSTTAAPQYIDDALVTVFHAPRSYTGDTLIEIAAHGAPIVLEAILRAALNPPSGPAARLAEPGEFTQRAFLSGRLDLTQAEAVHDLIAAQTLDQARVAAQQLGGALARQLAAPKGALLHLIALLEAGMDFASGELDDVDLVPPTAIAASIEEAREPLAALAATFRRGQLLRNGAALALIGPPNAGKSSLFNRLLERDRAIVTPIPGTTRDTLEESISLAGIPLRLIDTAGLRDLTNLNETPSERSVHQTPGAPYLDLEMWASTNLGAPSVMASSSRVGSHNAQPAPDHPESLGIARTLETLADADLILLVHDATQPFTPAELSLAATLADRPHILIQNKIDLTQTLSSQPEPGADAGTSASTGAGTSASADADKSASADAGKTAGAPHLASDMWASTTHIPTPIPTSALTGQGLDHLRSTILHALNAEGALAETALLNNLRQHEHLTAALTSLAAATDANAAALPHEVLLLDLHSALRSLDALTGTTTTDDILARIFSTFCIGK